MGKKSVSILSSKHLLDCKIYEILKRKYDVSLLNICAYNERQSKFHKSLVIDCNTEAMVLSTETLLELFLLLGEERIFCFLDDLYRDINERNIRTFFVSLEDIVEGEYILSSQEFYLKLKECEQYILNKIKRDKICTILYFDTVYGASDRGDIYDNKKYRFELKTLKPVLVDFVALYIYDHLFDTNFENDIDIYEYLEGKCNDGKEIRYRQKHCIFGLVYKNKPEDLYCHKRIAELRLELGEALAKTIPESVVERLDYISPVPNTGAYYAMGLSSKMQVPYKQVLIKKDVNERSFGLAASNERKLFLWNKIIPIPELIEGKIIAIVDEAIFTGTTLKIVCEMLWECGAKEIYLCIPTPPCFYHCNYLVHPERKMLLEYLNFDYIKKYFKVTDIYFQRQDVFEEFNLSLDKEACMECFYGK
ncbi:MAG: phosphoribosyltransferase family protein [Lachnospiraceae bacterium]|nr:phosphoribosyltransferase family protein [Lachnospiraceae bacterium]